MKRLIKYLNVMPQLLIHLSVVDMAGGRWSDGGRRGGVDGGSKGMLRKLGGYWKVKRA